MSAKSNFVTSVKVLFVILIMLVLLELFVRTLLPQDISPVIAEKDIVLGYKLKPFAGGLHKTKEFEYDVKINSKGLREKEITSENKKNSRILFLGDSFTYGWGVKDEDRFSNILAENLSVEVINSGVPGYKISNIVAYFEKEGYLYSPDVVVLMYNLNTGLVNFNSAEYSVKNHTLVKKNLYVNNRKNLIKNVVNKVPFYSYISQNVHLFALFRNLINNAMNTPSKREINLNCKEYGEIWDGRKEREMLAIKELSKDVSELNSTLTIFILPQTRNCKINNLKSDIEKTVKAKVTDSDNYFINYSSYYYKYDGHWNKEGHSLVADILINTLDKNILDEFN